MKLTSNLEFLNNKGREDRIKVKYHHLARNQFCSGATFVPKVNGTNEDDGWIVSFVHDEGTNKSKVSFQ